MSQPEENNNLVDVAETLQTAEEKTEDIKDGEVINIEGEKITLDREDETDSDSTK